MQRFAEKLEFMKVSTVAVYARAGIGRKVEHKNVFCDCLTGKYELKGSSDEFIEVNFYERINSACDHRNDCM